MFLASNRGEVEASSDISQAGSFQHSRIDRQYHVFGKTLHLFKLRTALQQEEVNANRFKLGDAFRNLVGCADQS